MVVPSASSGESLKHYGVMLASEMHHFPSGRGGPLSGKGKAQICLVTLARSHFIPLLSDWHNDASMYRDKRHHFTEL